MGAAMDEEYKDDSGVIYTVGEAIFQGLACLGIVLFLVLSIGAFLGLVMQ